MFGKEQFSEVFHVGDIIEAGANPNRKNAARLQIVAIKDDVFRFESKRSVNKKIWWIDYSYVELLLHKYEHLDPRSIGSPVRPIRDKKQLPVDTAKENYAYSFAKAYKERIPVLLQGEFRPSRTEKHFEGRRFAVLVERDPKARSKCIAHFGTLCKVCCFDFEKQYGPIGREFIHVHHHSQQLSEVKGKHKVDPIRDLIPLCPNCHAMAHRKKPMLSIEKLINA